jgi:hypothetical protein
MVGSKKITLCIVADFRYLLKNFNRLYRQLRDIGEYSGDILVISNFFTFKLFIKNLREANNVYLYKFKKIKFEKEAERTLSNLKSSPNRHLTKNFQWHKLYLFHEKIKKWDYVFYLDINMNIHDDINPILQIFPENEIFARADGYPEYKWKLESQFDQDHEIFNKLKKNFDLDTVEYFQTGLLYFDTNIISKDLLKEIKNLVNKFPISITNEQGILNIYFKYINPKYKELVKKVDGKLSYFYWYDKNDKTIITKALTKKNK